MPIMTKDMEAPPPPPAGPPPWPFWLFGAAVLTLPLLYYYIPSEAQRRREENRSFRQVTSATHELRVDNPRDPRWDDAERLLRRHFERYLEIRPGAPPLESDDRLLRHRAEVSYLLGTTYLVIARRQAPPSRNPLLEARRHLLDAARRGYAPSAVASSIALLLAELAEAGELDLAWGTAEEFVDPAVEALAPFREHIVLVRDRARLAARLAAHLALRADPAAAARAEALAAEARRLAGRAVALSRQTEHLVAALRLQADVAFGTGDLAEARLALDRLLELHDKSPVLTSGQQAEAHLLRGKTAARLDALPAALEDFDRAVESGSLPVRHEALYHAALANRRLREPSDGRLPPAVKLDAGGGCPADHPVRWQGQCLTHAAAATAQLRELVAADSAFASVATLELARDAQDRGQTLEALDALEASGRDPALAARAREGGIDVAELFERLRRLRAAIAEDEPLERVARILGQFADRFSSATAFRAEEARAYQGLAERADAEAAVPDTPPRAVDRARARGRAFRRLAGDRWALLARHESARPIPERLEHVWAAADNYFNARAYAEAVALFTDLTSWSADDPRRSEAFYRAGIALQRLGRYEEAVRHHQHNLDAYPDSPAWTPLSRLEQGLAWLAMGDTPERRRRYVDTAIDRFRKILGDTARLTPESEVWRLALFHLGRAEAERRQAEVLAAGAGRADPTSSLASAARRHLTEFLRRYAPEGFPPAPDSAHRPPAPSRRPPPNPYAVPAATLLGGLEQGERRYAEARAAYRIAIALGGDAAPPDEEETVVLAQWPDYLRKAFFARGDCALAEDRFGEAVDDYTDALARYDLMPDRLIGYLGRCRARIALADQAADRKSLAPATALAGDALRDLDEAERSLVQFKAYFERRSAAGEPSFQPLSIWGVEIASVKALLRDLQKKLGLVRGGGE